jgi:methionyl-tRNA synthetase
MYFFTTSCDGFSRSLWSLVNTVNKYIDDQSPWVLAKDKKQKKRLGEVLYNILETFRIIAILTFPFMPSKSRELSASLGLGDTGKQTLDSALKFGSLNAGTEVKKIKPLFPRIQD